MTEINERLDAFYDHFVTHLEDYAIGHKLTVLDVVAGLYSISLALVLIDLRDGGHPQATAADAAEILNQIHQQLSQSARKSSAADQAVQQGPWN